ncbi:hypothetical protein VTK26DRAFT_7733 [Humicola hyalothermophila]
MRSLTLVSALGATVALAKPLAAPVAAPAPAITAAPLPQMVSRALGQRGEDKSECESKADAIHADEPHLDFGDPLARWFETQGNGLNSIDVFDPRYVRGVCSVHYPATLTAPDSIASAFTSYMSESAAWVSRNKQAISSVAEICDDVMSAGLQLLLISDFDSCTALYDEYLSLASELAATAGLEPGTMGPSTATRSSAPTQTAPPQSEETEQNDATTDEEENSASTAGAPGFAAAAAAALAFGAMVAL